jgi:cysteine desulfurase
MENEPRRTTNGIYLDHNASAPLLPAAREAMLAVDAMPGNAASGHRFGRLARLALENAREEIAALLDARADDVIFTSGATEANHLALLGLIAPSPGSLVTSAVEHPCVLEPAKHLAQSGYRHIVLPVTAEGVVALDRVAFPDDTRWAGVMLANHETGAIQPVADLVSLLANRAPFHCDAAAAVGKMPISFRQLGVTSMTLSAHKFHGPQGIGALIVRKTTKLMPMLRGGHQQQSKRPGTEPVALAVGMAAALRWSLDHLDTHRAKLQRMRQRFLDHLRAEANPVILNGPETTGLPHALNLSFPGCQADLLLMSLDLAGLACSTGSACTSGSLLPSPVLQAMGVNGDVLRSAMRFSFGALQDEDEADEAARRIVKCVRKLRSTKNTKGHEGENQDV